MKNEGFGWDSSFNIHGTSSHLQEPIWLFWLGDVLSSFAPILEKAGIYSAVYISQFSYTRNINVFKAFLERWSPDTNTFHATYGEVGFSLWDLCRISGLPYLGGLYEEYTPTNDVLYSDRTRPTCRALFDIYANKEKSKNISLWSAYFVEPHADSFQRRQNISDEVYLAGFLASWLSGFVLPHSSNEVRSSTFVMASKMARGLLCSLAIPVFAYLYHCFNKVANSSIPGNKAVYGPFQYFFGWISIYFPKTYAHGNPSNGKVIDKLIPYLGFIGTQATGDFHLNKEPYAQQFLVSPDNYFPRALTHDDEPKGRIHDDKDISSFLLSYLICLRPGILTFKVGSSLLSEPYAPSRYARQFGFCQACPRSLDTSCREQSNPATFFYYWCEMLRKGTNVTFELPSTRHLALVTEPYARWWIASSFVVLQFSPELKQKQSNQPKTSKKRMKKTAAPIILDNPSAQPNISTSRLSSSSRSSKSSGMLLEPDKAARPSPRRYPQGYLRKILESKCRQFYSTPVHFEFENPEAVICPLETIAYIDSLFDGKDSILEGKDIPAILNIFEKGRELLVLGRVKASTEAPSLPLSSEHSASASNLSRGQSKHDSQGETNDEDNESEDETDELYNYTPLSDCSPKSAFKGHPSSHSTISTAPIGSPKPIGSLLSRSATSSAAMATFKDHASSKNSWQATPSKSLPSLTPQDREPPVQSIPLSSNKAAVHIQKGLFISLQSSTISIEDIITQSNGIISILKSFKVDLSSLYEKMKALAKYFVLWTKVSSTSDKDVSLRELEAQYEVKKTNFDEMASSYEEMASSVTKLSERVTSLEGEIARTKELLKKLESELSSCKAKHSSSQSDLTKYSETISKSEEDLHVALDVVDQCKKKSAHYDAVKEALDAARASLMN
ncbi:hypothetical protein RHSIM_Rhsim02G0167000 [Rhododendron simsii]|uniref:Aminotransferase-like plant mobile domain-containing protein n=1 Tax=Rhododendron simsii TaxID=118357 RepID=A0A834HF11_RHOSS|nr:hypothetical protein RHSIM_Rhsim02G0167000 [Rhododendron simsii]